MAEYDATRRTEKRCVRYVPLGNSLQFPFCSVPISFAENVIVEGMVQLNGRLAGLRLPDDLILRNSSQVQNVNQDLVCDGSVRIYGELRIEDTLNRHNYSRMCDLLSDSESSAHALIVNGECNHDATMLVPRFALFSIYFSEL